MYATFSDVVATEPVADAYRTRRRARSRVFRSPAAFRRILRSAVMREIPLQRPRAFDSRGESRVSPVHSG
ncbi:hypothetical protein MATL_G00054360 [Megalops atlanticus]|uniref:Uncharacterized protein n=1 Tax=Megalops atlanticus TaxID=7932 RepID=A0A9D3TF98_MEGAT|nr:hypothetical protein MATL_G00054360 [Megalops atlanticus]